MDEITSHYISIYTPPTYPPYAEKRLRDQGLFTVLRIRIRIQEGKNDPQQLKKCRNFMFWSAG
jgi:hypothetical protein